MRKAGRVVTLCVYEQCAHTLLCTSFRFHFDYLSSFFCSTVVPLGQGVAVLAVSLASGGRGWL